MKKYTHDQIQVSLDQFIGCAAAAKDYAYTTGYLSSTLKGVLAELPRSKQESVLNQLRDYVQRTSKCS